MPSISLVLRGAGEQDKISLSFTGNKPISENLDQGNKWRRKPKRQKCGLHLKSCFRALKRKAIKVIYPLTLLGSHVLSNHFIFRKNLVYTAAKGCYVIHNYSVPLSPSRVKSFLFHSLSHGHFPESNTLFGTDYITNMAKIIP